MIVHVVLFRPKPEVSVVDRAALVVALAVALRGIPGIRRVRVGRRVTVGRPYEALMRTDYTHSALLEFDDLAGLRAYLEHPAHRELATRFFDLFEEALMYDYDVQEGAG
jgi:hypothetical protein